MATDPQELAQGAENDEPLENEAEGQPPEDQQPEADETPEAVAQIARKSGWVPKEEWSGPEEMWKPADQFLLDGKEIQKTYRNELKSLRQTMEAMTKTNAQVMEVEISRRVDELAGKYQRAVDDGDTAGAYRLANEIGALTSQKPQAPSGPPPEAQDFASRNATWFQKDPLGTALAIDVCNRLAGQGYDHATQLQAAEKEVRRVYPHLFGGQMNGSKPQAGVNRPGGRGPVGNGRGPKGWADLPLDAQKMATDMIERGVIKTDPEAAKKLYAEKYWQNVERKA